MMIDLICVDADDTLWHNEKHFLAARSRILELNAEADEYETNLVAAERSNIGTYGFGVKSFILSAVEALALTCSASDSSVILGILEVGKNLLSHPIELLDGVEAALTSFKAVAPLALVTKGDLLHQEAKLASSGLAKYFDGIDIVSDKSPSTFERVFARHQVQPERALVIGDSLRSDIIPALAAGANAAYIPHPLAWSFEHGDEPESEPRYRRFANISEVADWLRNSSLP